MTGRRTKTVVVAMVLATAIAEGAAAQAPPPPPTLGGGTLPTAAPPRTYTPSVNLSLQPRGARIAMLFDSTVLCGRDVIEVSGSGEVPFDGTSFSLRGASARSLGGGRLTFEWTVSGQVSGSSASGTLRIVGARRRSGRTRKCTRKPDRPFEVRLAGLPAGGSVAQAVPRGFYAGTSSYEIFDRMQAPVALRASTDGRKFAAQWVVEGKCGRGPREHFRNFTPAMRIRPAGTFSRNERFSVRYADVLVRYRTSFSGRLATDGATGTLRLRTRVYDRRGTKLRTRCDSSTRTWNAAPPPA